MNLLLRNARVVDEDKDFVGDLLIKDGKIEDYREIQNKYKKEKPESSENRDLKDNSLEKFKKNYGLDDENFSEHNENIQIIDATGLVVMPSFIDMHAHFRDPGYTYKEDLKSGSLAALRGGYTCVNLMANTNPMCSSLDVVNYVLDRARQLDLIDIHQSVSITKNFDGVSLDHLDTLDERVKFISDDGKGVQSNLTMYLALIKAKEKGLTVIAHEEDNEIVKFDTRLSENLMTFRDIYLTKLTGSCLHLAHVSTKEALKAIRKAKKEMDNLTCEVTPHHIFLYNNDYRVNPPIREKEDVLEIIEGIKDGTVDVIATDHAPHSKEDKNNGAPGISGLETAFSVCYTRLVKNGEISLNRLSQLLSANPARLMKVNKGKIKKGYDGDIVILDLEKKRKIEKEDFFSKGKNTPFDGMELYGDILATIRKGEIKYGREKEF